MKLIRPSEISAKILTLLEESDEWVILVSPYMKIPHLHSKLYMNEKSGIVTSMNCLLSSEINSLEIGYSTETPQEYKELLHYYQRYIRDSAPVHNGIITDQPAADLKEIIHSIREELRKTGKNSWFWFADKTLHISTGLTREPELVNKIPDRSRTDPGQSLELRWSGCPDYENRYSTEKGCPDNKNREFN